MRFNDFTILTLFFSLFSLSLSAQSPYTPGYYRFPFEGGRQHYFAGTLGELRGSHFHGGLDIKTDGQVGWPVLAAADGFVSRIKVANGGYGKVLYMQHGNGQTTVYAHLHTFNSGIADYVIGEQYRAESFAIELFPEAGKFAFKKGEVIAYAGNSGSSSGPHLHFEIRDSEQRPLNPVGFGFTEVKDNIPPTPFELQVKPLNLRARVEGQFPAQIFTLSKKNGSSQVGQPIKAIGEIGIELKMHDRANGTSNRYGINRVVMKANGEKVYEHLIDRIPFARNRYLLSHIDYAAHSQRKGKFERLYQTKANRLPIYPNKSLSGIFDLHSGEIIEVEIELYDSFQNLSTVRLQLVGNTKEPSPTESIALEENIKVIGNTLYFTHAAQSDIREQLAKVFSPNISYHLRPSYTVAEKDVYLWNLERGLPDSIVFSHETLYPTIDKKVEAGKEVSFQKGNTKVKFPASALFEDLYFSLSEKDDLLYLGNPSIPLKKHIEVSFTPKQKVENKNKSGVYSVRRNGSTGYVGGKWEGGSLKFSTRDFGVFTIGYDFDKPKIRALQLSPQQLQFMVKDENSGIKSIKATINGEWLLMDQDLKKDAIYSIRKNESQLLKGDFRLEVTDHMGNVAIFERKL